MTPPFPSTQQAQILDPAAWRWLFGSLPSESIYVSDTSVGGLPAIGRGVEMVSNAVATMMVGADVINAQGDVLSKPSVVERPWLWYGSYEYWTYVVSALMMRGNFVGLLTALDDDGYPTQVFPINPAVVTLDLTKGYPAYQIDGHTYRFDQVIHIRSHAPLGGTWGQGIIERYHSSLSGSLYAQRYGTQSFKEGSVPSVVVQVDTNGKPLADGVANAIQTDWIERHGGGERKPAVVPTGMTITPLSFSPHDSEFVESRKLSIAECALICGLSPSDLEAGLGGQNLTYANLTQRALSRITDSYGSWLRLIEEGWSDLLPSGLHVRGNPESLLRTSTAERYELHKLALDAGWMTKDEVRAIEGLPPLPVASEQLRARDSATDSELTATDDQFTLGA